MSNFLSNLFSSHKNKNNSEKCDDHSKKTVKKTEKKTEKSQNKNEEEEDLPPIVIPRRFSLSKSGRMKEKKRTKLAIYVPKTETVMDHTTHKSDSNSKSASRESLDKTEKKS